MQRSLALAYCWLISHVRLFGAILCVAWLGLALASPAGAAIVMQHVGNTDPATEGFSTLGTLTGSPINDGGTLAWVIDDNVSTDGLEYNIPSNSFTPAQTLLGSTDGWQLKWKLRIVDGPVGSTSRAYEVGLTFKNNTVNTRRYTFFQGRSADGDPLIEDVSGGVPVTEANGLGGGYHTYELINYGGATNNADLFIDGQYIFTTPGNGDSSNSLYFGSRTNAPTGQGNWALFSFNVGAPPPAPEPSTALLCGLGALMMGARRRRQRGA